MHEMAVAENILKVIEEKLKKIDQKGEIKKVNLKIGKLTCIEPEALRLSFEVVSKETPFEKVSLFIDSVPITGICKDCSKELLLEKTDFTCPACGSFRVEIKTGRELFIESFEIE
jgi:hydrogenase nickel incorporation protein HypA/HybF